MRTQSLLGLFLVVLAASSASAAKRPTIRHKARAKALHPRPQPKLVEVGPPLVPPYAPWPRQAKDIDWPKIDQFSRAAPSVMRSSAVGLPAGWFVETPSTDGVKGILSSIGTSGNSEFVKIGISSFLVMQGVGVSGRYNGRATPSVFYDLVGDYWFAPQISDDGRRMLLHSGSPTGSNDGFGVHSWDFSDGKSLAGGHAMNNGRQRLSPSGLSFASVTVVNTENYEMQDVQQPWKDNEAGLLLVYATDHFIIGDASSGRDSDEAPGKKYITDLAATRALAWTSDGRILYTHAPTADKWIKQVLENEGGEIYRQDFVASPVIDALIKYPSVWIADPRTKATHQVIERAYDPSPSPDGKFIAFFGWPLSEKPTAEQPASVPKLWLYQIATKKRFEVNAQNAGYLGWTPDSKTLVTGRFEGPRQLHVGSLALRDALQGPQHVAGLSLEKAVVEVADDGATSSLWPRAPIEVRAIARNGRYLVVGTIASKVPEGQAGFRLEHTLYAVNLSDGHISTIAHAKPPDEQYFSWSWFDESDAPAAK